MNHISAVIITLNEERNILRCIESLQGIADEIVVVDSGSTDDTQSRVLSQGVQFVFHPWEGYAEQKNFAEKLASHDWILSLDADEALSQPLQNSLQHLKSRPMTPDTVYSFRRLNNYCGTWIHHCGWYPDEKVRLWHRGVCHWDGLVHEELRYLVPVQQLRLDGSLLHYTYRSVADHAARQQRYALLAAQKAFSAGRHSHCGDLLTRPLWTFLRNYLFKGGFLDGRAGFMVCSMSAFYTFLKYARLRELQHNF